MEYLPNWIQEFIEKWVRDQHHFDFRVNIYLGGCNALNERKDMLLDIVNAQNSSYSGHPKDTMFQLDDIERVITDEINEGYTWGNTVAVVSLWSKLEHNINNLLCLLLTNEERCKETSLVKKAIDKLKKKGKFIEDNYYEIIKLIDNDNKNNRIGIKRFNYLLSSLDIPEVVTDGEVVDNVLELQQVRNLIVHSNSIVDSKFLNQCPNLGYRIGDEIKIDRDCFKRYYNSVLFYFVDTVIPRLRTYYGLKD